MDDLESVARRSRVSLFAATLRPAGRTTGVLLLRGNFFSPSLLSSGHRDLFSRG